MTSIATAEAFIRCHLTDTGPGVPHGSVQATITQVTECTCDYNYGFYQNTCRYCNPNRHKNTISNKPCSLCPLNLENAIITTCTCKPSSFQEDAQRVGETGGPRKQCAVGLYNAAGGSVPCTPCQANMSWPQNSDDQTKCICNIGFTGPNAGPCTLCQAGKYKNTSGDAVCTDCAADQYSTVTAATSSSVFEYCTCNSMVPAGSDTETAYICYAGWFGVDNSGCSICPANTYSGVPDSQACTSCPVGHITPSGGASVDECVCNKGSDTQCECARASTEVH